MDTDVLLDGVLTILGSDGLLHTSGVSVSVEESSVRIIDDLAFDHFSPPLISTQQLGHAGLDSIE